MATPTSTLPVGVISAASPFHSFTVYRDQATTQTVQLWITQDTGWRAFGFSQGVPIATSGDPPTQTTLNLWWNPALDKQEIGYYSVVTGATIASSPVKLNMAGISVPTQADSTSNAQSAPATLTSNPSVPLATSVASQITASPAAATSHADSKSKGLSGGAVAGVAIGCLIAGALIAALAAWFCLGRRRKAGSTRDSEASTLALMHKEKGPTAKAISLESGSPIAAAMENGLPQPLEDKAISGEISKISNLIKNHVQSYYHTRGVSPGMIDYDDIQALGNELPVSTGTLSTLLGNSATREIALRFCIAWVVVSRMQLNGHPGTTFLPPEISKCSQEMSPLDRGSRVHAMFFAKWRVITAELMQSSYVSSPFSPSDARLHSIQNAASVLDNVLRPYSDSRVDNGQRSRNLEEILKRAALFAYTLFSQPSSWDFDWQREQGVKSGSICIFPSLVQVADENGEPIKPARPFSEAVVRRLDE